MQKGLVIKTTGSWCQVDNGSVIVKCRIKGKLRLGGIVTTNPVTVGDRVEFDILDDGTGLIRKIEERDNYIIRRSTSFHKEAHLLAANIDQALIMVCLKNPKTPREFIDRFLVTAEAYHIESILLINKVDLLNEKERNELKEFIQTYSLAGYSCIEMSVTEGLNMDTILNRMKSKMNLLAGNSGVGKSSMLNRLDPSLDLKTKKISEHHKAGKHATTFSEVFRLDENTYVIDSPGIRGFGLIDLEKSEIGLFFPEIFRISKHCKFYNCTHLHEPGCAVIEAVKMEKIGFSRFNSYVNIMTDEETKYR